MSCTHPQLSTCGCCETPTAAVRTNRPGLGEIAYRPGTHTSFLRDMRDRLSLETLVGGPHAGSRPLAALGTRDLDDPSIALLDSAATMLDVLTFYSERLANEGFLGTATERLSVLHLARAIGYELSPGVATDVTLVLTVGETPGEAPSQSRVPAGTKVQSLPAGDALPQTFETLDDFTAYRAWNALRARTHYPQTVLVADGGGIERLDVDGNEEAADEIVLAGTALAIAPGDLLVVGVNAGTTILRVTAVATDLEASVTRLTVEVPVGAVSVDPEPRKTVPPPVLGTGGPRDITDAAVAAVVATRLSESELQVLLTDYGWDPSAFLAAVQAAVAPPQPMTLPFTGVFALRSRVGLFGHNAQPYDSLPISQREGEWHDTEDTSVDPPIKKATFFDPVYPQNWEGRTVWTDSQGVDHTDPEPELYLARDVDEVLDEGWVVLDGAVAKDKSVAQELRAYHIEDRRTVSLADYGMTGQVTGLDVLDPLEETTTKPDFLLRRTVAQVASSWLELADIPIDTTVAGDEIELDRMVLNLAVGQSVVVTGPLTDPEAVAGTEVATIDAITHQHGRTTLTFASPLANSYVRDAVTVHANALRATQGETVDQPLGGGDGAVANQAFALRRSPLTYVAAATATGSASTLDVRVNGRLWYEVRSLYDAQPADQVYTVRIGDDATATVTFGDGVSGARPPTGAENITASYRAGNGPEGEVDADTITLLMTRPPGVASVNNPLPASGAEAPETFASAKANAPMTVRTLDRVVSLTDFEDFAATFAGIGKARADVVRLRGARMVHLTVGSSSGGAVSDDRISQLIAAIDAARDPGESVCASSYRPVSFDLIGSVKTAPALVRDTVMTAVREALTGAFAFDARRFGQGASVAEIMRVIHDVEGVIAVDIDTVEVQAGTQATVVVPPLGVLAARPARLVDGATHLGCATTEPAELLLVNSAGIELGNMP